MQVFSTLLNQQVCIRRKSTRAMYYGTLVCIRNKTSKVCIANMVILNKEGTFKCAPKYRSSRWFPAHELELVTEPLKF